MSKKGTPSCVPSKEQLVYLNIYDLEWSSYWPRKLVWILGLGVFHSGVEIYGNEVSFAAMTGIFQIEPKCLGHMNEICKYKTSILIGHTELTKAQVLQAINDLGKNWQGLSYHLFSKNCNDFSDKFCQVLCKKSIPGWVNRLAKIAASVPFLDTIVPTNWVQPCVPTNQSPKPVQKERIRVRYPDQSDDGSDSDQNQAIPCCSTSSKRGNNRSLKKMGKKALMARNISTRKERIRVRYPDQSSDDGSDSDQRQASPCCSSSKCGNNRSLKKTVKKALKARKRGVSTRSVSHNSVKVDRIDLSDSDSDDDDDDDLVLVRSPIRISSSEASRSPSPVNSTSSRSSKGKSKGKSRRESTSKGRSQIRRKSRSSRSRSKSRASRTTRSQSKSRASRTTRSQSNSRASRSSRKQSRTRIDNKSKSCPKKSQGRTYRSKSRKRPASRTRTNSRGCKRRNVSRSQSQSQNRKVKPAGKKSRSRRK